MIRNKHGHLDGRNALSAWSFIKWIVNIVVLALGSSWLLDLPENFFSWAFLAWIWIFIKEIVDTPLVILWLVGALHHKRRKKIKRGRRGRR